MKAGIEWSLGLQLISLLFSYATLIWRLYARWYMHITLWKTICRWGKIRSMLGGKYFSFLIASKKKKSLSKLSQGKMYDACDSSASPKSLLQNRLYLNWRYISMHFPTLHFSKKWYNSLYIYIYIYIYI